MRELWYSFVDWVDNTGILIAQLMGGVIFLVCLAICAHCGSKYACDVAADIRTIAESIEKAESEGCND